MKKTIQKNLIGINGETKGVIQIQKNDVYFATGGSIVKENLNEFLNANLKNPGNSQKILHLHDNKITALSLSPNGEYLASGQKGTENYKSKKAFVALIRTSSMEMEHFFMDIEEQIIDLKFSTDSKFLAVSGTDNMLAIYSLESLTLIFKKQEDRVFPQLNWITKNNENILILVNSIKMRKFHITGKNGSFFVKENYTMLVQQIKRNYEHTDFDAESGILFAGTSNGEISVFDVNQEVFVCCEKIYNHEINALKLVEKNILVCGFADGVIQKFQFRKNAFEELEKIQTRLNFFDFFFNSLTKDFLVLSKKGELLSQKKYSFDFELCRNFPNSEFVDSDFFGDRILACFLAKGDVIFWDFESGTKLGKYASPKKTIFGRNIYINNDLKIMALSYSDNSVKIIDISNLTNKGKFSETDFKTKFSIIEAHKGNITSLYYCDKYLLTSCDKSLVRIWHSENGKMIHEFNHHMGPVQNSRGLHFRPELIFSCSKDRHLIIYDLKTEKRIRNFSIPNGFFKEVLEIDANSLISAGQNCPILFWNLTQDTYIKKIDFSSVNNLALSFNKKILTFVDSDKKLIFYDLSQEKVISESKLGYFEVLNIKWISENEVLAVFSHGYFFKIKVF